LEISFKRGKHGIGEHRLAKLSTRFQARRSQIVPLMAIAPKAAAALLFPFHKDF